MHSCATIMVLELLLLITHVRGQVVSPFATHDCSGALFYSGDHYCNNSPTTCCAATGLCCAGGCCPELATCVFQGTSNEACCNMSDPTLCGSVQPVSSKTCPNPAGPSVPCSGVESTWNCAHGCTCDDSRDRGCNCFGGSCSDSGSGDSSSAAATTSTYIPPAESSSSDDAASSTPVLMTSSDSAVATSAGSVAGVQTTSAVAGASGSTTSSAAAAGTTTKASDGTLRMQAAWALSVGALVFGVMVVL